MISPKMGFGLCRPLGAALAPKTHPAMGTYLVLLGCFPPGSPSKIPLFAEGNCPGAGTALKETRAGNFPGSHGKFWSSSLS